MQWKAIVPLPLLFLASLAAQRPNVVIYPRPREETKLAVADFVSRTQSTDATRTVLKVFNRVLWDDLKFSAFFEMPSKNFYPLKPLGLPRDVDFDNWQVPALDVDFLIFGNVLLEEKTAVVEAYLYDVKTRQQVLGKRYTVADSTLIRRVAHQFADQVVFQLSAGTSRGVARTRIAFSSLKGTSKEIYIMDYDGSNVRTVTSNGGLNKFPEWSSDSRRLAFVTHLSGSSRWQLWIQDLAGGRKIVPMTSSYVSSPVFSPEGEALAFSSRGAGRMDSDIFVLSQPGDTPRNLTRSPGIDTSPSYSPTGRQITFISDRSGTPQVWVMDADGSNLQRLVSEGGHCDSPDWSPDGRFIAYSWQAPGQWKHDIYVIEVATGRIFQLTSGAGSNESPHWSPDGRHLCFQSNRTGSMQIYIMNADGKNRKQITAFGVNEGPAWSGYLEVEEQH